MHVRVLGGRPEGIRPLGRPRRRWEDNIKMDLRESEVYKRKVETREELLALILHACARVKECPNQLRSATLQLSTRAAKCTEVDVSRASKPAGVRLVCVRICVSIRRPEFECSGPQLEGPEFEYSELSLKVCGSRYCELDLYFNVQKHLIPTKNIKKYNLKDVLQEVKQKTRLKNCNDLIMKKQGEEYEKCPLYNLSCSTSRLLGGFSEESFSELGGGDGRRKKNKVHIYRALRKVSNILGGASMHQNKKIMSNKLGSYNTYFLRSEHFFIGGAQCDVHAWQCISLPYNTADYQIIIPYLTPLAWNNDTSQGILKKKKSLFADMSRVSRDDDVNFLDHHDENSHAVEETRHQHRISINLWPGVLGYQQSIVLTLFRSNSVFRQKGDMTLLAEEEVILRDMLLETNDTCENNWIKIDANKTKTMVIGREMKQECLPVNTLGVYRRFLIDIRSIQPVLEESIAPSTA
ncbi:hypothetical protein ANN_19614 [Periplaneta americana]|uniref:Uncharacterized protein n=1 Tax=Periplaneta americana TaxID=6978 RepID=A0ABQ8SAE4_PERAM|nr:hypothetical protein ANN_19614 [Periplaneta americana]